LPIKEIALDFIRVNYFSN